MTCKQTHTGVASLLISAAIAHAAELAEARSVGVWERYREARRVRRNPSLWRRWMF